MAAVPQPLSGSSAAATYEILRELTLQKVIVVRSGEVRKYLEGHAELGRLLPQIAARARQEFGDQAELALEVCHDPETPDRLLTMYIRQVSYRPPLLDRIDSVWLPFEDRLSAVSGDLLVTTDFHVMDGSLADKALEMNS